MVTRRCGVLFKVHSDESLFSKEYVYPLCFSWFRTLNIVTKEQFYIGHKAMQC